MYRRDINTKLTQTASLNVLLLAEKIAWYN